MSVKTSRIGSSELVVLDETGSDSSPESDVQIIDDETSDRGPNSLGDDTSKLMQKLKEAKAENKLLKQKFTNLSNSKNILVIGPEDNPVVTIHFTTEAYSLKYRTQMENLLKNLLIPESDDDEEVKELVNRKRSPLATFFVDNKASSSKHKSRKYPIYDKEITDVMTDEVIAEEKVPDDKPRNSCFNCCGDHLLHECSKPIDRQQIMINRKGFYNKFGGKQSRYHVDLESQTAKFRPGLMSQELQRALNLGENQLPLHIYRMRVLGYPPGWLCEAKVESSGITMFDAYGKAVAAADEVEEGEVADGSIRVQFDPDRLVDYPGFNTYPQSGIIDESEALGFPPMQEHHLKSSFVRRMKPPQATPYKRKIEPAEPTQKNKKPRIEVDMEIDDTASEETNFLTNNDDPKYPLEEDTFLNSPVPTDPPGTENAPDCPRPPSPSLEELEKQKNQLMEQLDSADSCNSQSTSSTCTLMPSPQVTRSKCVSLGTPIPEATSPYVNLPDASKFSATITEHMNFENLPDTTGNFDKMKVLLTKIRRRSLE